MCGTQTTVASSGGCLMRITARRGLTLNCNLIWLFIAGFRPSFHLYNKWSSLVGALVCVVIMFMLSWWAALVTVLVVGALYIYLKYRKPGE